MDSIGGRKFLIAIILVVLATIFVFIDRATFTEWATFSGAVLGLFSTGNLWSKHLMKRNGNISV